MEFAIELVGGPNDGEEIDLVIMTSVDPSPPWPESLYVSRLVPGEICTSSVFLEWDPERIKREFREYHRTKRITASGRRAYAWKRD